MPIGDTLLIQSWCFSAISICSSLYEMNVGLFLISKPLNPLLLRLAVSQWNCLTVGFYSPWHTYVYGYNFLPRWYYHTLYHSFPSNLQQEWRFNVWGAVVTKWASAFAFHFRPCILWWKLFVLVHAITP